MDCSNSVDNDEYCLYARRYPPYDELTERRLMLPTLTLRLRGDGGRDPLFIGLTFVTMMRAQYDHECFTESVSTAVDIVSALQDFRYV